MAELIERDLTIHSLSQHLSQGLYKGTDYMNDEIKWCCRVDISPVEAYARGFEYGIRLAQTIVSNQVIAYDVEKVVEQLQQQANQYNRRALELVEKSTEAGIHNKGKACSYEHAIEIVRKGGVE
jgi:hypothetical protein